MSSGGNGPGEEVALGLVAAELSQAVELVVRLDAFGDGSQAEVGGQVDDGRDDPLVLVVGPEALHERLVDLHEASAAGDGGG